MIFLRDTFDEEYIKSAMSISGIFNDGRSDLAEFQGADGQLSIGGKVHIAERRKHAEKITRDGVVYYKYDLIACINHGLARQEIPLPSGFLIILST